MAISISYVGTGAQLKPGDIGNAARSINLPTPALLAWIEVEVGPAVRGFDSKNRPVILPEPHKFYANLGPGAKRSRAVAQGLAYPKWGTKPYPATFDARYNQLARMAVIDEEAALDSTSIGLGQILGSNAEDAGSENAVALFSWAKLGESEQLASMVRLIQKWGIVGSLAGKDLSKASSWEAAAKRYNGAGYKKNKYHEKLAKAFVKHSEDKSTPVVVPNVFTILRNGMRGEPVMTMQAVLLAHGFDPGPVDGRFGNKTEKALRQAQHSVGVPVTGAYDEATKTALAASPGSGKAPAPVMKSLQDDQPAWWVVLINTLIDIAVSLIFNRRS